MIEARGGKYAYVYMIKAARLKDHAWNNTHSMIFDTADSDDEAYGRAMRVAMIAFPQSRGWSSHYAMTKSISGFDWVGRFDLSKITPED